MVRIEEINADISIGLLDLRVFAAEYGIALKREIEKAGTSLLLKQLMGQKAFELLYTPENKPCFKDHSAYLSISHSHDYLAIIVNKKEHTGIDIELIREKILRVRHKFLTEAEQEFACEDLEKLITIWGAKEAMYKSYGLKGVDFREHIQVEPFTNHKINGELKMGGFQKKYILMREKIEDYILVYILNEI